MNLYTYSANNPLLYVDPSWHNPLKSIGNWFKDRYNDCKSGWEIIIDDPAGAICDISDWTEDKFNKSKDVVLGGLLASIDQVSSGMDEMFGAFTASANKISSAFSIFDELDNNQKVKYDYSEDVVNIGMGQIDNLNGQFEDLNVRTDYVKRCGKIYDELWGFMECYEETSINNLSWDDMDKQTKDHVMSTMDIWDPNAFGLFACGSGITMINDAFMACLP